jgi:hypothetical protein
VGQRYPDIRRTNTTASLFWPVRRRPRDLVDFHTRHKLQILAHDPARYQQASSSDLRRRLWSADASELSRGASDDTPWHSDTQGS